MRQDSRQFEIQIALFQPRVERPEWNNMPAETKQAVLSLIVELLQEAAAMESTAQIKERTGD